MAARCDECLARFFNLDDEITVIGAAYDEIRKAKSEEIGLRPDLDRHGVEELRVFRPKVLERRFGTGRPRNAFAPVTETHC